MFFFCCFFFCFVFFGIYFWEFLFMIVVVNVLFFWVRRFLTVTSRCLCCSAKKKKRKKEERGKKNKKLAWKCISDWRFELPPEGCCWFLKTEGVTAYVTPPETYAPCPLAPPLWQSPDLVSVRSSLMADGVKGHIWARMDFPQLYTGVFFFCTSTWQHNHYIEK